MKQNQGKVSMSAAISSAPVALPTLEEALAAVSAQPLWDRYQRLNPREPKFYEPIIWPWSTMAPLVERAVREVSMNEAERRVILLTHDAFPGTIFTLPSISGALQILEPGESAHAHRHALAAIRMVMMGEGAVTITDGKECPMEPGDLILTPSWTWHEHRHPGKQRMVWFDGLDYPLCVQMGTVFFEHGESPAYPRGLASLPDSTLSAGGVLPEGHEHRDPYSPLYRYAWQNVKQVLENMPAASDGSKRLRYSNPATGGAVMPTLDCYALGLATGASTTASRSTSNAIAVVIRGEGETRIGEKTLQWKQHDVFTLPRWQWIEHQASCGAKDGPATLFLMTDRELVSRMGYLREESRG